MKLVVARVPKEEENAAPSDAGADPPANEAVFQVVAPTQTDEDGDALSTSTTRAAPTTRACSRATSTARAAPWRACRSGRVAGGVRHEPLPRRMKMGVARAPNEEEDAAPSDAGGEPPANEAVSAAADLLEVAWAPRPLRSVVQRRGAAGAERPGPKGVGGVSGCPAGVEEPLGGGELEGRGPDATSRPSTVSPSPAVQGGLAGKANPPGRPDGDAQCCY